MRWASSPPFTQIRFFFFFHRSSSSSCYHSTGTISTAYARGTTATPSGGTQTTTPLLPLSLSPPHPPPPLPALAGTQVKLCFFSSFFVSFLTIGETSFPHMLGPQTPTSPSCLAPQASQVSPLPLPHSQACK